MIRLSVLILVTGIVCAVFGWIELQDQSQKIEMLRVSRDSLQSRCQRATAEIEAARIDAEIQLRMDSRFWRDSIQSIRDSIHHRKTAKN